MKLRVGMKLDLKTKEVGNKVKKANQLGLRDLLTDIVGDVIRGSPHVTGHNRRSIAYKLGTSSGKRSGGGAGEEFVEWEPGLKEGEAAVYSTSGYGGFLETGTVNMPAQPYFRPALDKNKDKLGKNIKAHL